MRALIRALKSQYLCLQPCLDSNFRYAAPPAALPATSNASWPTGLLASMARVLALGPLPSISCSPSCSASSVTCLLCSAEGRTLYNKDGSFSPAGCLEGPPVCQASYPGHPSAVFRTKAGDTKQRLWCVWSPRTPVCASALCMCFHAHLCADGGREGEGVYG